MMGKLEMLILMVMIALSLGCGGGGAESPSADELTVRGRLTDVKHCWRSSPSQWRPKRESPSFWKRTTGFSQDLRPAICASICSREIL